MTDCNLSIDKSIESHIVFAIGLLYFFTMQLIRYSIFSFPGAQGPPGVAGVKGDKGLTGAKGEQGKVGLAGQPGERGPQGLIGLTGSKGHRGEQGMRGEPGLNGPIGRTGEQGPHVSILSLMFHQVKNVIFFLFRLFFVNFRAHLVILGHKVKSV